MPCFRSPKAPFISVSERYIFRIFKTVNGQLKRGRISFFDWRFSDRRRVRSLLLYRFHWRTKIRKSRVNESVGIPMFFRRFVSTDTLSIIFILFQFRSSLWQYLLKISEWSCLFLKMHLIGQRSALASINETVSFSRSHLLEFSLTKA